jgi:tripartite-type tricarboxylate transporter receptor subunit TctC
MTGTAARAVLGLAVALVCFAAAAQAQHKPPLLGHYPNKPIRILVGASAGGGTDLVARMVGGKLAENWSANVIVDNRAGGAGVISMNILAQAAPDGYTLSIAGNSFILTGAQGKVAYDAEKAYDAVVQLTAQPYLVVVNPALGISSVKELIAYAASKPGALNYGSSGTGSVIHLGTELLDAMAGISMVHVPYKGVSPALLDATSGRIQVLLANGIAAAPHLKSGRLRAIAVTSRTRTALFPELPTVSESGVPGYELDNMYGVYAPAGVPPAVVGALNAEFGRIVNSPEIKSRLALDGAEAAPPHSAARFRDVYLNELHKWAKFIRTSGIRIQ